MKSSLRLLLTFFMSVTGLNVFADGYFLSVPDFEIKPGESKEIVVYMDDESPVCGLQCYITLPEGLSFDTRKSGRRDVLAQIYADRWDDHTIASNLDNGVLKLAIYSANNYPDWESEGPAFSFYVKASDSFTPGEHDIRIWEIHMVDEDGATNHDQEDFTFGAIYKSDYASVELNSESYATYSSQYDAVILTPNVKAYKARLQDTNIILSELDGYIPAGTGVLLHGEESLHDTSVMFGAPNAGDSGADISGNSLIATTNSDGSLTNIPATGYTFALGEENKFLHYTGNSFIANRAYLWFEVDPAPASSSAKALHMLFDNNDITGITDINGTVNMHGKFYENHKIVIKSNGKTYNISGQIIK